MIPFLLLDLPFSLIFDFVTFPYDLCRIGQKIDEPPAPHHKQPEDGGQGEQPGVEQGENKPKDGSPK